MIDSSNFSLQSSLEANYLNIELRENMKIDETAFNVIRGDCPDFLIPFHFMNINDKRVLKYKLINAISLQYSSLTLSKELFTEMYYSLLTPYIEGRDWFLDYHSLCIDPAYVYLSKDMTKAYFIYIPERSCRNSDEEILRFFQNVLSHTVVTDESSFMVRLYQYFSRGNVTLTELYKMVQEEKKNQKGAGHTVLPKPEIRAERPVPVQPNISGKAAPVIPMPAEKPAVEALLNAEKPEKTKKKHFFGKDPVTEEKKPDNAAEFQIDSFNDDEVMAALFDDGKNKKKKIKEKAPKKVKEKSGGLFKSKAKPAEPMKEPEQKPAYDSAGASYMPKPAQPYGGLQPQSFNMAMPDTEDDVTEIAGGDMIQTEGFLELISSPLPGAPARISLGFEKPFITLGRVSSNTVKPDILFDSNFRKIGRMHARIEKKGDDFYVIDLGSSNHTFLNGQMLAPNQAYPLTNGSELSFTASEPVRYRVNL